ncbi:MAG TPA: type II toxin-antitoxin system VapC family toxin [Candidatus Sulfotelmatobacter sp.]|nr:type II toxin-antitoxin system VapC family toxin [Candidatus Sulfotelmatobacter sp.]
MSLVIDSSIALAWIYFDETTEPVRKVYERLIQGSAWVPALWRLEVANVLETGVRRKRHHAAFRDSTLADLSLLPIQLDPETDTHAWSETLKLAVKHQLTLYDGAYLELALRRGLPLASLDQDLRAAAKAENLALLGM